MEIIALIEEMEKMVEGALHIPLSGKVFLDGDMLLDYLDRLRSALPEEIRQAQWIRQEKERLLEEARLKAQQTIEEAIKQSDMMAAEHELTRKARINASEIMTRTQNAAEEIKAGAVSYAEELLVQLEADLEQYLNRVRQDRQELRSFSSAERAEGAAVAASLPENIIRATGTKGSGGLPDPDRPAPKR